MSILEAGVRPDYGSHAAGPVESAVIALQTGSAVILFDRTGRSETSVLAVVGADNGKSWDLLVGAGNGSLQAISEVKPSAGDVRDTAVFDAARILLRLSGATAGAALTRLPAVGWSGQGTSSEVASGRRQLATAGGGVDAVAVSVQEVAAHSLAGTLAFESSGPARLPTQFGDFDARCYRFAGDVEEHLVLTSVLPPDNTSGVRVALHRECEYGDVFGNLLCGCRDHLETTLAAATSARGVAIYLRRSAHSTVEMAVRVATVLADLGLHSIDLGLSASGSAAGSATTATAGEPWQPRISDIVAALRSQDCHSRV